MIFFVAIPACYLTPFSQVQYPKSDVRIYDGLRKIFLKTDLLGPSVDWPTKQFEFDLCEGDSLDFMLCGESMPETLASPKRSSSPTLRSPSPFELGPPASPVASGGDRTLSLQEPAVFDVDQFFIQ